MRWDPERITENDIGVITDNYHYSQGKPNTLVLSVFWLSIRDKMMPYFRASLI